MELSINKTLTTEEVVDLLLNVNYVVEEYGAALIRDERPLFIQLDSRSPSSYLVLPVGTDRCRAIPRVLKSYVVSASTGDEILFPSLDDHSVVVKKVEGGWSVTLYRKLK